MPKNAIYLAKNAIKNQTFCQMLCGVRFFNAFYAIRNLGLPFSNANSEAGMRDITAIQVLSGV